MRLQAWRGVVLVLGLAAAARAQPGSAAIDMQIKSYGFGIPSQSGTGFRTGQWTPLLLELTLQGGQHFQGELHCESTDLDGDVVAFVEKPIVLTAGGGPKRVWCYAVTQSAGGVPRISLRSESGVLLAKAQPGPADAIPNDTMLVLDISARPEPRIRGQLAGAGRTANEQLYEIDRPYYRPIVVGTLRDVDLPDRWFGLESVDVVIWDEPDPDRLSLAQLEALDRWVRSGGRLIVGLGQSWAKVQKSPLARLLPYKGDEPIITTRSLPRFLQRLTRDKASEFSSPIALVGGSAQRGLTTFKDMPLGSPPISLITMETVGSGRVVTVASSLRDLAKSADPELLVGELFDVNPIAEAMLKEEAQPKVYAINDELPLFSFVALPTEFRETGGLFVLAATVFVLAYIGLATIVSWLWLKRHAMTYLSWSVFAGFAIAASLLSLGTVAVSRGFSRVRSVSLVDLEAGSPAARAHCWFGYRSPTRARVNLTMSGEGGFLRAMTRTGMESAQYATPQHYTGQPAKALLEETPMRATLKQFEGYWQGPLGGAIRGQLIADRKTGRLSSASFIKNDTGMSIAGGYLLYMDPRLQKGDTEFRFRPAGLPQDYLGRKKVPPALSVLACEIPAIKPGEQVRGWMKAQYADVDKEVEKWQSDPGDRIKPDLATLFDAQQLWVGNRDSVLPLGGTAFDRTWGALLLASMRDLYLHCKPASFAQLGKRITTEALPDCDISHWLMRGQAVLLLIADEPGPAQLSRDGQPMKTQSGVTLFRVRMPIDDGATVTEQP